MMIVADTNIFLAVALNEPEKEGIVSCSTGCDLIAPSILPYETGNALSALIKRKILTEKQALHAWNETQKIPVSLKKIEISKSLQLSFKYNIYAYDAYFLLCAIKYTCALLTLDKGMKSVAQKMGIQLLREEI